MSQPNIKENDSAHSYSVDDSIYQTVVESYDDLVFLIQNNRIKFANPSGSEQLGYSLAKIYSFNIIDIISHSYKDIFIQNIKRCLTGQEVPKFEIAFLKNKGGEVLLDAKIVCSEHDEKPAALLFARDITNIKKESTEVMQLSAAVRSLHSAVTITDMQRNIIYINPAHKDIFGYSLDELMGKNSNMLYPFEDPSGVSDKIYEAILMLGWEGERLSIKKDGEVFPVYEKTSVVKDKNGNQIAIVSVVEDITIRKQLARELEESEERYRTLVDTANRAIVAFNDKGKVTFYNPAAENIFGYTKDEILQQEFQILVSDRYKKMFKSGLSTYFASKNSSSIGNSIELCGLRKQGDEFPIECSFSVCKINGENVYTAIIGDITERNNLQDQLTQSAKLAAVGELISGVTHEVNNPLAVVLGYSEMILGETTLDDDLKKSVQVINNEANRARKVIQNLLSFARKHSSEKQLSSINDIIENTVMLKEYDYRKHNINVTKKLDPQLPDTMADPNQLQQVFLNLLINAEQAMLEQNEKREITIESKCNETQDDIKKKSEQVINISFKDHGSGIDEIHIKNIFDPFFSTKPEGIGTGLGLSVSYGIIKDHGGSITVQSNKNEGATFFIELPVIVSNK